MCSYSDSSPLAAAADFLAAHRGRIALVTLDIGANDVDGCVSAAGIDNACVAGGIAAAGANLPVILGALTAAQVAALDTCAGPLVERGVLVAFDHDRGGRQAALRAYELLRPTGAWPTSASLPDARIKVIGPGPGVAEITESPGNSGVISYSAAPKGVNHAARPIPPGGGVDEYGGGTEVIR
ncbi:MAG TPA: hypothetical protein VF331_12990 [Polyangiales bacterium]